MCGLLLINKYVLTFGRIARTHAVLYSKGRRGAPSRCPQARIATDCLWSPHKPTANIYTVKMPSLSGGSQTNLCKHVLKSCLNHCRYWPFTVSLFFREHSNGIFIFAELCVIVCSLLSVVKNWITIFSVVSKH